MAANNQNKQMFVICGLGAAICALAVGGGFYAKAQIEEIDTTIEGQRQAISAAEAKIVKIPAIEKEVVILRENLDEYVKILPDNAELPKFVRMLNQFEKQSGGRSTNLIPKTSNAARGNKRFVLIEYSYEMTATLWEMLRFVNLIENYERFVNISEFSITTGSRGGEAEENTRDGDAIHTIRLTMQTYTYNGKSSGKDVAIPGYDDLRESLREEIFKRMQAIRIDKYEHRGQQGRRDIFVDPRIRGDEGIDGLSPAEQRAILERYITEAEKLREMLRRVKRNDTTLFEQYALEKGLREGISELTGAVELDADKITYAPLRVKWNNEVTTAIEDIRAEFERAAQDDKAQDPFLPLAEIETLVAHMKQECENGYLEEARQRYETVAPQLQVPAEDPRHALSVEAKALHTKAVTALDFRQMDIRIQGVVVDRTGRSGVLLNGEVYEEGEYVSEELLVKMVEEEQVWFVFRGLTLVRTM